MQKDENTRQKDNKQDSEGIHPIAMNMNMNMNMNKYELLKINLD